MIKIPKIKIDAQQRLVEQHLKETETMVEQRLGRLENGIDAHQQKQVDKVNNLVLLFARIRTIAKFIIEA
jgi:hypothetical protein